MSKKSGIGKLGKYLISLALVIAVIGTVFFIKRKNLIASQNVSGTESENVVTDIASENSGLQIIDATESVKEDSGFDDLDSLIPTEEIESVLQGPDFTGDVVAEIADSKPSIDKIEEPVEPKIDEQQPVQNQKNKINENKFYYSKDDVALYIYTYKKLPKNFVTKSQAEKLGWTAGTPVSNYGDGLVIGGDRFYNREKVLPTKSGRNYTECDIDSLGKKNRGAKRIVFSNDGLIYYTGNHYESFDLLYGEE